MNLKRSMIMSTNVVVTHLSQLQRYLNENNVVEVITRDHDKRIKRYFNIILDDPQTKQKELAERAVKMIQENNLSLDSLLRNTQILSGLGYANMALSAVNLCATCAGFVIIYKKMQQISSEINQHLSQLDETVRKSFDIDHQFKLDKVLADHNDMLDSMKRQQPYSERDMRRLVDSEHRMIMLLINTLKADVSNDQGTLIISLFSLMGMFTASLCYFDEIYYFNNPQCHGYANPWHTSHDSWMGVYETMCDEWFIEKLQDYSILELGLRTWDADVLYLSMLERVVDAKMEVEDNQILIVAFGSKGALQRYRELSKKDVVSTIHNAYREAADDTEEADKAVEEALQRVGLA